MRWQNARSESGRSAVEKLRFVGRYRPVIWFLVRRGERFMNTAKSELSPTMGITGYVHLECLAQFLVRLREEQQTIQPDRIEFWKPEELIGRYKDITHCDQCGGAFGPSDRGYLSCWVVSLEQMAVWLNAQSGKSGG